MIIHRPLRFSIWKPVYFCSGHCTPRPTAAPEATESRTATRYARPELAHALTGDRRRHRSTAGCDRRGGQVRSLASSFEEG